MFRFVVQSLRRTIAAAFLLLMTAVLTAGSVLWATGSATAQTRPVRAIAAPVSGTDATPFVAGLDDNRVQMVVAQQDLSKTLEILSEQTQLKFTMSKGLKGTTTRLRIDGTGRAALNAVANQVGAVWWWNGSEVRLAARNDIVSHSVKARDIDYTISTARDMGLPMDMLAISKPSGRQNVKVSGPAGLVADFEALNEEISGRLSNVSLTKFGRRRVVKIE
jgi:hypothetical protein